MNTARPLLLTLWPTCLLALWLCAACAGSNDDADSANNATTNNADNNQANNADNNQANNADNNQANNASEPLPYSCDVTPSGDYEAPQDDQCDLIAQDCAQGQGCYLADSEARCLEAGTVACGEACELGDDCMPGQICAGTPKRCLALCERGRACPNDAACDPLAGRDDVGVCVQLPPSRRCSAVLQNCPDDQGCYLADGQEVCAPALADAAEAGDNCTAANGCERGALCVGPSPAELRCRVACDPSDDDCEEGTCTLIQGTQGVGVCL